MLENLYTQIINNSSQKGSKARALEQLRTLSLENTKDIPTLNRIEDIYGGGFWAEFGERITDKVFRLTVSDLMPVIVNPLSVMAVQSHVSFDKVMDLLRLKVRDEFWPVIYAQHDPTQPIIVIRTPHGLISVNGHHRIRALQLRRERKVQLLTLPADHSLNKEVLRLFRQYGYLKKVA